MRFGHLAVMFFIDPLYAAASIMIMMALFIFIHVLSVPVTWGDVSQALIYHQVLRATAFSSLAGAVCISTVTLSLARYTARWYMLLMLMAVGQMAPVDSGAQIFTST